MMRSMPMNNEPHELDVAIARWAKAERESDVADLDDLLTDDFVGIGPRGLRLDKRSWLQRYESGDLLNDRFELSDLEMRHYGSTAVVNGLVAQETRYRGNANPGMFRFTLAAVGSSERLSDVQIERRRREDQRERDQLLLAGLSKQPRRTADVCCASGRRRAI
jgi:ketosteroid isomerase-like protein